MKQKYCTSFYGCDLCDLYCEEFNSLLTTWGIYIRKAWGVPSSTHRRFITPLSGFNHIRTAISKRFLHFFRTCINYNHSCLLSGISRIICHNVHSNTARNIRDIQLETNKDPLTFEQLWKFIKYHPLQEKELYKIHVIKELTEALVLLLCVLSTFLSAVCALLCTTKIINK